MTRLPRVSGQDYVRALGKAGFRRVRQRGSHITLRRDSPYGRVIVPEHREIDRGTLRAIIRQAGLSVAEFNLRLQQ